MISIKKLTGVKDWSNPSFVQASDGITYRAKMKSEPMKMLADVFFSKLSQIMGYNSAENDLIELDYSIVNLEKNLFITERPTRWIVGSKNFLEKNQTISSFKDFNNLEEDPYKVYFSASPSILQDINLSKFFKYYMKDMSKSFKDSFINEWWQRTYFRDADQYRSHNLAVVYKNQFRNRKEAVMAPAHDFEYCMLSDSSTMNLEPFAVKYTKLMDKGMNPQNVDFLKKEYRDISENFLASVESLENNSQFDSLCEFSHLASFFNSVLRSTDCDKYYGKESVIEKLTKASVDVRKNCLKRGELLLSQWK